VLLNRLQPTDDDRTQYDEKNGAVRSFFGAELVEQPSAAAAPEETAKTSGERTTNFLEANKDIFQIDNITLVPIDRREGSVTESVSYQQRHHGVRVYGAQLVVGLNKADGRVASTVNQVDYELPDTVRPEQTRLNSREAAALVRERLKTRFGKMETGEPRQFVYRHVPPELDASPHDAPPIRQEMLELSTGKAGEAYLVWQILLDTQDPSGNWEILVDAISGELVAVNDRRSYATRKGFVFTPDPITTSGNVALSSKTGEDKLNPERREVDLNNLNKPTFLISGYRLDGKWAETREIESPTFDEPVTTSHFKYGAKDRKFLSVMAYYWVDSFVEYLRGFNVTTFNKAVEDKKLALDAQGVGGEDNSHFTLDVGSKPILAFGEGGVPDAADAHVIVHEYGHALHWYINSRQNAQGNEEGAGDFLGGAWLDRFNTHQFERDSVFPWDNNRADRYSDDRFFNTPRKFSDPDFNSHGPHVKGSVLAAALWDMFLRMGGNSANQADREAAADQAIHMYLEMLVSMPDNSPVKDLVNGLIAADQALNGGSNATAIKGAFRDRGLNIA
jgi:zinc metalloprotease ZmpB